MTNSVTSPTLRATYAAAKEGSGYQAAVILQKNRVRETKERVTRLRYRLVFVLGLIFLSAGIVGFHYPMLLALVLAVAAFMGVVERWLMEMWHGLPGLEQALHHTEMSSTCGRDGVHRLVEESRFLESGWGKAQARHVQLHESFFATSTALALISQRFSSKEEPEIVAAGEAMMQAQYHLDPSSNALEDAWRQRGDGDDVRIANTVMALREHYGVIAGAVAKATPLVLKYALPNEIS